MNLVSCEICGLVYDLDKVVLQGIETIEGYDNKCSWNDSKETYCCTWLCYCGNRNTTRKEPPYKS